MPKEVPGTFFKIRGQEERKEHLLNTYYVPGSVLLDMHTDLSRCVKQGLPSWLSGKESIRQCRRHGFDPWVGEIPWRRKWQPTAVLLFIDAINDLKNDG